MMVHLMGEHNEDEQRAKGICRGLNRIDPNTLKEQIPYKKRTFPMRYEPNE